jgi:predicted  nucleic acid-binding Zn-ribbon protein
MLPDLARLIRLQELDLRVQRARQAIAELPDRLAALEARVAEREAAVVEARARLTENQQTRRALEKDQAELQRRLSRYKDQLMEVKTNKEYQAMLKEIAAAEQELGALEDRLLERLLEADELQAAVKRAEADLAAERAATAREREALEAERIALERDVAVALETRAQIAAALDPAALHLFEHIARLRKGIAVAEARDGHCSLCHVRLRPQVYNSIRRNDAIIQCESCHRILYFPTPSVVENSSS